MITARAKVIFKNGAIADLKNIECIKLYHTGTGEKGQHWNLKIDNIGSDTNDTIYIINEDDD